MIEETREPEQLSKRDIVRTLKEYRKELWLEAEQMAQFRDWDAYCAIHCAEMSVRSILYWLWSGNMKWIEKRFSEGP